MRKILVPIDGSECSLRAITYFLSLRDHYLDPNEIDLHLVNVQPPLPSSVSTFVGSAKLQSYHHDEGAKELQAARALLDKAAVKYESHISIGDPADVISRFAKERGVDQIVIGIHGRSAMMGILLGSVATKILAQSPVPVLVVK